MNHKHSRITIEPVIINGENLQNQTGQLIRRQQVNKEMYPERHGYWVRLLQTDVELRTMKGGKKVGREENDVIGGFRHAVDLVYDTSIGALRVEPAIAPVCKSCGTFYLGQGSVNNTTGVECQGCGTQLKIDEDGKPTYDWSAKSDLVSGDVRRLIQRDLAEIIDNDKRIRWSTARDENGMLKKNFISGLDLSANGDQRDKMFVSKQLLELNEWLNMVADAGQFKKIPAGTGKEAIMNTFKPEFLKHVYMSALKRPAGAEEGEVSKMPVLKDEKQNLSSESNTLNSKEAD